MVFSYNRQKVLDKREITIIQIRKACINEGVKQYPKMHSRNMICEKCVKHFRFDQIDNYIGHYKTGHDPKRLCESKPNLGEAGVESAYLPEIMITMHKRDE